MINPLLLSCIFLALAHSALGDYTPEALADEVISLPGLTENINFKQFSGYLKVNSTKNLHYWMVESQVNYQSANIISIFPLFF